MSVWPALTFPSTAASSLLSKNLLTRMLPVWSVMSKHSTEAPRFCISRLLTAKTSPFTVTAPLSRFRLPISESLGSLRPLP